MGTQVAVVPHEFRATWGRGDDPGAARPAANAAGHQAAAVVGTLDIERIIAPRQALVPSAGLGMSTFSRRPRDRLMSR